MTIHLHHPLASRAESAKEGDVVRIYLSSTYSDLQAYREAVYRTLRQLRHDVIAMEDYVAADERPADKCLADVAACEVYVGLFAWRYGYIPPRANPEQHAITEMEYREAGKRNKHRLIFILHEDAPWQRQLLDEITGEGDRGRRIHALRAELCQEQLVSFFTSPEDLAHAVSVAMNQLPAACDPLRQAYLNWLIEQVRGVPLAGIDPKTIREESRRDLDLAAVYTALMTRRTEAMDERAWQPDREQRQLSALEVLNRENRVALLGDPGSGKSTFVNFVALCLAGELLGRAEANLGVLTAPVPEDEQPHRRRGEDEPEPQPWDRGALLPVRVILREFVARGLQLAEGEVSRDTLWQFIVNELPGTLRDFASDLRAEWQTDGGLLLLDGLDEVPEAGQRREQIKTVVEQFATVFPRVVILVTSRTYAYQQQDWKLRDFAEATLQPFGRAHIRNFVERWHAYVGQVRNLSVEEAQGRATLLNTAIASNPRLYDLATRPLLLTLMASLHAWRGGTLPEQREELYADAVDLLLE